MEHRYVKSRFQTFFDFKTSGGADVFQIDTAEARSKPCDSLDDFFRILSIQTNGNGIDTAEFLKQYSFSFHDGHCGMRTDVAKAQNRASVGYYGYGIGFHGIFVSCFFIRGNNLAGLGNSGGVGYG